MKKNEIKLTCLFLCLSISLMFVGCSSDDDKYPEVDGQIPSLELKVEHIQTAAGRQFVIEGAVTDKDGISLIKLECPELNLDKTINIIEIYGKPLDVYDLNYKFNIQRDEKGDNFVIKVTVVDVGGRVVTKDLLVTMDGDFENPVFTLSPDKNITVLMKEETKFNLSFSISDDRALDYIIIEIPGIEGLENVRIDVNGQKTYDYSEKIVLPNEVKDYDVKITAVDKVGNETVSNSILSVSEMPDFEKMYLADVATVKELNSDVFGVPMRIERIGEYQYKANYYNQKAGTEILFIPQKSDFSPICFGLDPEDNTTLSDDPEVSKPFILDKANIYYEFTIDILKGTYEIKTYPISEAANPIPHEYGSTSLDTWADGGSWLQEFYFGYMTSGPTDVMRFTQDKVNPNLFYLEDPLFLEAGTEMNFVIHNWHSNGWWNYCTWRVDNSAAPEIFGYYGEFTNPLWTKPNYIGDNWAKPIVNITGDYVLSFDAHLERAKLVPAN